MKSLMSQTYRLSFLIIIILAISCKKDNSLNDKNEDVYSVNFKLLGFSNQVSPLKSKASLGASSANTQNYTEGYLFFWSFNDDSLLPDITHHPASIPSIIYANGDVPNSFVNSNYSHETFAAGRALSFSGARDILIKMPLMNVLQFTDLGFDVGSPSTGPKDFEIYYSLNKGIDYEVLAFNNQFGNTNTPNQKHSYAYDLTDFVEIPEELWIKIIPKAGERGSSGVFNESSGTLRMDNLFLTGIASVSLAEDIFDDIHYFLFNIDKPEIVVNGRQAFSALNSIDISLPRGVYKMSFLTNKSASELMFPHSPSLVSFYVGNIFSNSIADIFGYSAELTINQDQTSQIEMERLYSQIKIEFTDTDGLDQVTKITIDQQHEPFYYSPLAVLAVNPILDQSSIERMDDFAANKQLVFHQFIGKVMDFVPVNYTVNIYGASGLLRAINLSSTLKNNMQLVFRGSILDGVEHGTSFVIIKNENWDGQLTTDF